MNKVFRALGITIFSLLLTTTGFFVANNSGYAANNCVTAAPTVSIPINPNVSYFQGIPGGTTPLNLSITNNDSSACGSVGFYVRAVSLPSGYTFKLHEDCAFLGCYPPSTLTLAPGAKGSLPFDITPSTNAIPSLQNFTVESFNKNDSTDIIHTRSASATISIVIPPTVTILSPVNQSTITAVSNGLQVSTTAKSNNNSYIGSAAVYLDDNFIAGCDNSAASNCSVVLPASKLTSGQHSIKVLAYDVSMGSYPGTAISDISVSTTPCVRSTPTMTATQSAGGGTDGDPDYINVSIKNNDSAGCAVSRFNLTPSGVPTGFTSTTSTMQVSPGQTGNGSVTITSPSKSYGSNGTWDSATKSYHTTGTITVTADDPLRTISAVATFNIFNFCQRGAPVVSVTPMNIMANYAQTLTYSVAVQDVEDTQYCSGMTYTITATDNNITNGFKTVTQNLTLQPGQTSIKDISITLPSTGYTVATNQVAIWVAPQVSNSFGQGVYPTFTINSVPPTIKINYPSTGDNLTTAPYNFRATANGDVAKIELYNDSTLFQTCSEVLLCDGSIQPTGNMDGSHTFVAKVYNHFGAMNSTQSTYSIVACVRAKPTVTIGTPTLTGSAFQKLNYSFNIKNNDSASCSSESVRALVGNFPSGFILDSSNASQIAPGASQTVISTVLSPSSAQNGSYNLTFNISGSWSAQDTAQVTTTYVVNNNCTRGTPALTASPTSQSGSAGTYKFYTVTLTNNDVASTGCGPSSFYFVATGLPYNFSSNLGDPLWASANTYSVDPGKSITYPVGLKPDSNVANTVANVDIRAVDQFLNNHNAVTQISYIVGTPPACTRGQTSAAINPFAQSGSAGQTLAYTLEIINNDSAGCGDSTFSIYGSTYITGYTFSSDSPTIKIPAGQIGRIRITVTSPSNAPNGPATFNFNANDASQSLHNITPSGYFYVDNTATCVRNPEELSVSPSTQSGAAGSAQTYVVTLKNNDSSGCASSTYTPTTASLPSGFSGTFSPTTLPLIPGQSNTTTLTVTSPTTATNGTNNFTISATDSTVGSAHTATPVSATYTVNNPVTCTRVAPTITLNTSSQTGKAGDTLSYTVTIKNNDSAGCANSTFSYLTASLPSGFTGYFSPTGPILAPQTTGTTTLSITSPASAANGTNNFTVSATDSLVGSAHTATPAAASYIVNNVACTRNNVWVGLNYPSSITTAAGTTATYAVNIENYDSSGCPASDYSLSYSGLPSGFTASFAKNTVNLAPGKNETVGFSVTSPTNATNGTNAAFTVQAKNSLSSATASGNYIVGNPVCVRNAPTLSANPQAGTIYPGGSLQYTISITNNDTGNCNDARFEVGFGSDGVHTITGNLDYRDYTYVTVPVGQTVTTTLNIRANANEIPHTDYFAVVIEDNFYLNAPHFAQSPISITVGTNPVCTLSAPTISLSPTSQTGQAGSAQSYIVTLKDNDSGSGCAVSLFNLSVSGLPSGFTSYFGSSAAWVAAGTSTTTYLYVTSPTSALNGSSNFTVSATDSSVGSAHTSTPASATYVVNNPVVCTRGVPTVSVNPTSNTGAAGTTQAYAVTLRNMDSSSCASTSFQVATSGLPSGFNPTSTTITETPGSTNTFNIYVTSPSSASNQTVNFTISASDSSVGSAHTSTPASATYIVNNPVVCTRSTPSVSVSPSSNTGAAGSTQTYTVTLKNNDSTTGCSGTSTFSLSTASLPSGFSGSFSPSSLTLSPQGSGTSTLYVSSPSSASNQTVNFTISASDSSVGSAHTSTPASATYVVNNPVVCTRGTPLISISPSSQTGNAGSSLSYTVTLKNNDSTTGCTGSSTFTLSSLGLPSGFSGSFSPSSLTLSPQGSGTSTLTVSSPSSTSGNQTIIFYVQAQDSSVGSSHTSNQAQGSYTVQTTTSCSRTKPTLSLSSTTQTVPLSQPIAYYYLAITNNDSPACNFSSRLFYLAASGLPSNYYLNGQGSVAVSVAPGATTNSQPAIIVPYDATNLTINFSIFATDSYGYNSVPATLIIGNGGTTPVCTRGVPTITPSPSSGTGKAGDTLTYTVTVKNTDSTTGCSPTTFSLSAASFPYGFSSSFSPSSLTLSPQGTGQATLSVSSPSYATNNTDIFTITATDSSVGTTHSASTSATYIVNNPIVTCTRGVPTISINPSSGTGQAGTTLSYTLTLINTDSSNCSGTSTFSLSTASLPSGFSSSFSPSSLTLAAGATGTATIYITSPSSASNQTVNFTVSASDSSVGSTHTASTSATYTVNNPVSCTRGVPTISISPSSQTGQAGATLSYTVTLKNNDSTTGCTGSSVFSLSSLGLPSGFSGSFSPSSLTLSPQGTGQATLSVVSPSSATNSTNTFQVSATDSSVGSTHTSVPAQSSYIVSNPTGCSRAIPTITANPATTTITAGSIIYYTLTVTNNDSTGCGLSARTYTVMPFYLNSSFYVNGSASPTLTLNAGASGSVDFPVYSLAFAASGSSTAYFYAFPSDTYTTYSKVPIDITIGSVKGDSTTIPSNQPDNTSSTSPSTSPQPHSPGTLIKIDNTLYIVGNGGLIGIPSMAVLQSWGLDSTTAIPGNLADAQLFQIKILQTKQPGETGY